MTCSLVMLALTASCMWSMTKNRALLKLLREKEVKYTGNLLVSCNQEHFHELARLAIDKCKEVRAMPGDDLEICISDKFTMAHNVPAEIEKSIYKALGFSVNITIKQESKK